MESLLGGVERNRAEIVYANKTGSKQIAVLFHYTVFTIGKSKKFLEHWKTQAEMCEDEELKRQALNSIAAKDFHCYGGAVFAVPYGEKEELLITLIVAYQTLCDYLDNLCDQCDCTDGIAFRQLHQSLLDALTPGAEIKDYYKYYSYTDDGKYIEKLIEKCHSCLDKLPSYNIVKEDILQLARLYIDLQVYKHLKPEIREEVLVEWAKDYIPIYPGLMWQEFSAASGSTLAIFALFGMAAHTSLAKEESREIVQVYFPWICGLHILLDYLIDREEDRLDGELNFTNYYLDEKQMLRRIKQFIREAHYMASKCRKPEFKRTIIDGLLAMYLSDKKVKEQGYHDIRRELLNESGKSALRTYRLCSIVRKVI